MSGFSADWLAMREPADHAARAEDLARGFLAALPASPLLVDLGAGTGSNLRYLERLATCRWMLVDGDAALLAIAAERHPAAAPCRRDLTEDLGPLFAAADGVTATALLDLVSRHWVQALAEAAALRRLPVLLTLSVDERLSFAPWHADDALVAAAFARHQQRDKGFGPALGPAATDVAAAAFRARDYRVTTRPSDWVLGPEAGAFHGALLDGIAAAAVEAEPGAADRIAAWRRHRAASTVTVGHQDLLALPSSTA